MKSILSFVLSATVSLSLASSVFADPAPATSTSVAAPEPTVVPVTSTAAPVAAPTPTPPAAVAPTGPSPEERQKLNGDLADLRRKYNAKKSEWCTHTAEWVVRSCKKKQKELDALGLQIHEVQLKLRGKDDVEVRMKLAEYNQKIMRKRQELHAKQKEWCTKVACWVVRSCCGRDRAAAAIQAEIGVLEETRNALQSGVNGLGSNR